MSLLQDLRFEADGFGLTGTLHLPENLPAPVVIGCHGLYADRQSPKQIALARACNQNGLAYLRFDHRGCGDSEGDFKAVTSLSARRADLEAAVAAMRQHAQVGDLAGLFGSSYGGAVVLSYSARHAVPKLVTFAAPYASAAVIRSALQPPDAESRPDEAFSQQLSFDLSDHLQRVANILVAHGDQDELVPPENAERIFASVRHPKKLVWQTGGDHLMSNPEHQKDFARHFIAWLLG